MYRKTVNRYLLGLTEEEYPYMYVQTWAVCFVVYVLQTVWSSDRSVNRRGGAPGITDLLKI